MSRIPMIEYPSASPEAKREFDDQIAKHGRITNMKRTLLNDVPSFKVLMEWYPLRDRVVEAIGEFATNVFCYAISSQNNCLICSTFFRKILIDAGKNPDKPELNELETLLVEYGRACVHHHEKRIDNELFARLKAVFSDDKIVLLTSFAGMMIATNLINNALEVELDEYLVDYAKRK